MKTCPGCLGTDLGSFGPNRAKADGMQTHCRECKKLVQSKWYAKNQQKHIKNVAVRRKQVVLENYKSSYHYLTEHPCVKCGETDLYLLQYDHNQGIKNHNVSDLIANGIKCETILREIELCQVLCLRCHRKKSAAAQGVSTFFERLNLGV